MMTRLKIYIAGPYTATTEADLLNNVNRAIDAGIEIYRRGHFPYIPHLTHFVDQRAQEIGTHLRWEDYIEWDLCWLALCDALLYLQPSRGADIELRAAMDRGKRIFRSLDEITNVQDEASQAEAGSARRLVQVVRRDGSQDEVQST